ncbi:MAG: dihydropteroate synthase [Rhodomicrobium sp.]|nr:MAG: dihydropteroate synthase [Rhodomicrobium sp.]
MKDYWRPLTQFSHSSHTDEFLALTGRDEVLFGAVERIRRDEGGSIVEGPLGLDAARRAGFSTDVEERLCARRPVMAGFDFLRPLIMGILNVTPDSFYDGGRYDEVDVAIEQGLQMLDEGADIIDLGGESTRPGARLISEAEELSRVLPVIKGLREESDVVISIDTRKASVMAAAVGAGASLINDVSALEFDPKARAVAADVNVPVVLMHAQGTPDVMQAAPTYNNVLLDVYDGLEEKIELALDAGIEAHNLIIDPGIGFGKTLAHNMALMQGLSLFHGLGVPLLLGCSRKRFIAEISRDAPVEARLPGSLAGVMLGAMQGVQIMRVHDVAETRQALDVFYGTL